MSGDSGRGPPLPDEDERPAHDNGAGTQPDRFGPLDRTDRQSSDQDQTASELDQTASDLDQTASDLDRGGSHRDQLGADADQLASDREQAAANREIAGQPVGDEDILRAHEVARSERAKATRERGRTAVLRTHTATQRLESARRRDESARMRDLAAEARDRAAEARDQAAAEFGSDLDLDDPARAAYEFARATRVLAAEDRARAAADRARAARDREQAAEDLARAEAEIAHAHLDELTGAYMRAAGTAALQREIDRARHSDELLVLAFVDVDGFKEVNDRLGHAGGDQVLRDVVAAIRSKLRSYDPIVRVGGDEFVCALSGVDLDMGHRRFAEIGDVLRAGKEISLSVGLVALERGDTLEDLSARGDSALYDVKREHRKLRDEG